MSEIMASQTTLILLKTDCVEKKLCGEVIGRFEAQGFTLRGVKMLEMSDDILREHYAHIADKPFFPEVVEFMQKTPVVALALAGENIAEGRWNANKKARIRASRVDATELLCNNLAKLESPPRTLRILMSTH